MAGNNLQEEDLLLADDDLPPPLRPMATSRLAAGGAPTDFAPPTPPEPEEDPAAAPAAGGDVLRDYFANQKRHRERLASAEDTSTKNRFYARLGGAFNTLANAAAPRAADNSAFEQMAKDASNPVDRIERQQKLDQSGDKLLLNYFMNKDRSDALGGYRDKKLGLTEKAINERGRHNVENENIGKAGVGIKREGLNLREGTQAAQAAGAVNKDKVITTTNNQLAQIDKGIGRIKDIMSGKTPFTTTIKADLEKDIANVVSGGNSSSLGQLNRVEFHPYVADMQKAYDKFAGFQGDINSPKYVQQLNELLTGLRRDISGIQAARAAHIKKSGVGKAYSKNALATAALDEAVGAAQPEDKVRMIHPQTGKPGLVPKSQVQKALSQGYKVAQ